ncbi:MAG: hypothetical protein IPG58_19860 [Acidobacteria bacterium]|nr:hypothetical protein [Acidobacteriota bacterium]
MNICPQCSTAYDDENIYCLADGNALIMDGYAGLKRLSIKSLALRFHLDRVEQGMPVCLVATQTRPARDFVKSAASLSMTMRDILEV